MLGMKIPIRLSNLNHSQSRVSSRAGKHTYRLWLNLSILSTIVSLPILCARDINDSINNRMRHVDSLGVKLPSQRLAQSPERPFPSGKGAELGRTLDRGCCSRDDQGWGMLRVGNRLLQERQCSLGKVEECPPLKCQLSITSSSTITYTLPLRLASISSTFSSKKGFLTNPLLTL